MKCFTRGLAGAWHSVFNINSNTGDFEMFEETYEEEGWETTRELSDEQMDAIAELAYELSDDDDLGFEFEGGDYDSIA